MRGRVAFGEISSDSVLLTDAEGTPLTVPHPPVEILVVSRLDCDVKCVDVPPVGERELEGIIRFKVRSVYPGDLEQVAIDHIAQPRRNRVTVTIIRNETLQKYREAAPEARLVVMSSLVPSALAGLSGASVVHWTRQYAEVMRFESGALAESVVVQRERTPDDYARLQRMLGAETRSTILVAEARELDWIRQHGSHGPLNGTPVKMTSLASLQIHPRRIEPLYRPRAMRRTAGRMATRIGLAVLVVMLAAGLFLKRVHRAEQEVAQYRAALSGSEASGAQAAQLAAQYGALQKTLAALVAKKPVDTYRFLGDLREVLGPKVMVTDLVVQQGAFQLQAVGENSLSVMERFSSNPRFSGVTLLRTTPLGANGREEFIVSGRYRGD